MTTTTLPMMSSTAVRIVAMKHITIPPAIAEITTTLGEHLPIFDADVRADALAAMDAKALILPVLRYSQHCRSGYLHTLFRIDPTAPQMPCPWCREAARWNARPTAPSPSDAWFYAADAHSAMMERHDPTDTNGRTPQFACPRCSRRIYLAPVAAIALPTLPTQARSRLDRWHDALFTLDHGRSEAIYTLAIDNGMPHLPPYFGITAELEPFAPLYDPLNLRGLSLRLMGDPWAGRSCYVVV